MDLAHEVHHIKGELVLLRGRVRGAGEGLLDEGLEVVEERLRVGARNSAEEELGRLSQGNKDG